MYIELKGDPGTNNTFRETKINQVVTYVETYAPNATKVIIDYAGDKRVTQPATGKAPSDVERARRQDAILQYVGKLKPYVAQEWKNRYESTWRSILEQQNVAAAVYKPGKQKNTTFNRNLVANIIHIMSGLGIITETNWTTLTIALEGDNEHPVRTQLSKNPRDLVIEGKVKRLLQES